MRMAASKSAKNEAPKQVPQRRIQTSTKETKPDRTLGFKPAPRPKKK